MRDELGGTAWGVARGLTAGHVPVCRPSEFHRLHLAVADLIRRRLVTAVHAPGRGGLLTGLFYMARAGGLGLIADLGEIPVSGDPSWEARLFGESCGRFLASCVPGDLAAVRARLAGLPFAIAGVFDGGGRLKIRLGARKLVDAAVDDLAAAWQHREGRPA